MSRPSSVEEWKGEIPAQAQQTVQKYGIQCLHSRKTKKNVCKTSMLCPQTSKWNFHVWGFEGNSKPAKLFWHNRIQHSCGELRRHGFICGKCIMAMAGTWTAYVLQHRKLDGVMFTVIPQQKGRTTSTWSWATAYHRQQRKPIDAQPTSPAEARRYIHIHNNRIHRMAFALSNATSAFRHRIPTPKGRNTIGDPTSMHRFTQSISLNYWFRWNDSHHSKVKGQNKVCIKQGKQRGKGVCSGKALIAERRTATNELLRHSKRKLQPRKKWKLPSESKAGIISIVKPTEWEIIRHRWRKWGKEENASNDEQNLMGNKEEEQKFRCS